MGKTLLDDLPDPQRGDREDRPKNHICFLECGLKSWGVVLSISRGEVSIW